MEVLSYVVIIRSTSLQLMCLLINDVILAGYRFFGIQDFRSFWQGKIKEISSDITSQFMTLIAARTVNRICIIYGTFWKGRQTD